MKKHLLSSTTLLIVFLSLCFTTNAQTAQEPKDLCKTFFSTPANYSISSIYAMGTKMFFKKGESTLTVGDKYIIMDVEDEPEKFPMGTELFSITVKKGQDPIYAYKIDMEDIASGLTYVTVSTVKGKKYVTMFMWNNKKKVDIMKVELF